jgi:3-hydroxyacyl-CoA dehydrogenase
MGNHNPPVNGLGYDLRSGIVAGIDRPSADPAVKAVVLIGNERAFSGGADIREFGSPKAYAEPNLPAVIRIVEAAPSRWSPPSAASAWAAAWSWRWAATSASPWPGRRSPCPKSSWACCPAPAARSACRACSAWRRAEHDRLRRPSVPSEQFKGTPLFDEFVDGDLLPAALAFADKVVAEKRRCRACAT